MPRAGVLHNRRSARSGGRVAALWDATRDGELPVARYLDIVSRHAPAEPNAALLADAVAHAGFAVAHYAAPERAGASRRAGSRRRGRHCTRRPGSDAQLTWARALGGAADGADARSARSARCSTARSHPRACGSTRTAVGLAHGAERDRSRDSGGCRRGARRATRPRTVVSPIVRCSRRASTRPYGRPPGGARGRMPRLRTKSSMRRSRGCAGASRRFLAPFDAEYFAGIREVWQERRSRSPGGS
jgi:aminopeptidase N